MAENKETVNQQSTSPATETPVENTTAEAPAQEAATAATDDEQQNGNHSAEAESQSEEVSIEPTDAEKLDAANQEIAKLKDQLLRQMAEFDNYRKRTMREKSDLILSGGQRVLESLLPVLDDLDRAHESMQTATDVQTLKEGVELIIDKLMKALATHGLKKMDVMGVPFDTDFHEAIAITPAQEEAQKNHVIDCVQAGYMLGEKVVRHAKVVVGQ